MKVNNSFKISLIFFCLVGCKDVQKTKASPSAAPLTSYQLTQVNNFFQDIAAINFSNGPVDSDKVVKLNSSGKIDLSMLPPPSTSSFVTQGCTYNPIISLPDVIFTRANKVDIAQVVGTGLKVTKVLSPSSVGTFFGNGVGSKGFLGIASVHGQSVASFTSFKIRLKHVDNEFVYVNLFLDLDGDFTTAEDRIAVTMDAFGTRFNYATFTTVDLKPSDPIWLVSILGTVPISSTGLNPLFTGPPKPLYDLLSLNPNAKFYTGVFFDGGCPKGCPVPGASLVFGDSQSSLHQITLIESLEYNGVLYDFK